MTEAEKKAGHGLTCASCDYYLADPDAPILGTCRRNPPAIVPTFNRGAMATETHYADVAPTEFCGEHSDYRAYTLRGAIRYGLQVYRDWVEETKYDPGRFGDTTAAGFNKPPPIADAIRLSQLGKEEATERIAGAARKCGICGEATIPYGVDWPYWHQGACVHYSCLNPSNNQQEVQL